MKKALIIDDNVYKLIDIQKALNFNRISLVDTCSDQETALEKIKKSIEEEKPYDLIVTDMHYPLAKRMESDLEAGYKLIEKLKEENINIPVIICSSQNWSSPDAVGTVWYNKLRDLNFDFKELIDTIKE